jgi:hypothetical protein
MNELIELLLQVEHHQTVILVGELLDFVVLMDYLYLGEDFSLLLQNLWVTLEATSLRSKLIFLGNKIQHSQRLSLNFSYLHVAVDGLDTEKF